MSVPHVRLVAQYAVGREKIREFARAIGATDPLHHDLEAARAAGLRDLLAPPMFVAVYAAPIFREVLWDPALAVDRRLTVHGGQEFEWLTPVVAGDELTTVATAASDEMNGENRFIGIETSTTRQDGAITTLGRWSVIVRPPPTSERDA